MDFPKRKSPRIPGYDYSSANYYFVTICTHEKKCIFGRPGVLNSMGNIAQFCLMRIPELYHHVKIDKYVIMPNHVHVIFDVANHIVRADLSMIIGQFKMAVTKQIREHNPGFVVWQRSFHDHVIRNQKGYEEIWNYIENNPQKWEDDCFYIEPDKDESLREGQ